MIVFFACVDTVYDVLGCICVGVCVSPVSYQEYLLMRMMYMNTHCNHIENISFSYRI